MTLNEAKLNTQCLVTTMTGQARLHDLGLNVGEKILVKFKSVRKHTLLVIFNASCFTIKDDIAQQITVQYA